MSGYRYDELTESWVVITPARRKMPTAASLQDPKADTRNDDARNCPFCPGHESETEVTVATVVGTDGAWQARVVRNRFPIVSPDATLQENVAGGHTLPARGIHEVLIEAREHAVDLGDYSADHAENVLQLYRDRLRALEASPGVRAVCVYRNRGRRAGSSQPHPHGQLLATNVLPTAVEHRRRIAERHAERTGQSLLETLLYREFEANVRIVEATEAFVVLCPFAPHRAYETWIVPRAQAPSFSVLPDALVHPFATILVRTVRRISSVTENASYNIVIRMAPVGTADNAGASWHLEVLPRTGGDAGFELGTGMDAVPIAPETAAEELRGTSVDRQINY